MKKVIPGVGRGEGAWQLEILPRYINIIFLLKRKVFEAEGRGCSCLGKKDLQGSIYIARKQCGAKKVILAWSWGLGKGKDANSLGEFGDGIFRGNIKLEAYRSCTSGQLEIRRVTIFSYHGAEGRDLSDEEDGGRRGRGGGEGREGKGERGRGVGRG